MNGHFSKEDIQKRQQTRKDAQVKVAMKVTQSCQTLWPMDYTVQGILQAIILGWVAFPFSRGSLQPRDGTQVSCTAESLPAEPPATSPNILGEMQIKTTVRYHCTTTRMAIIKKTYNHKYWRRCKEIRALIYCGGWI